MSERVDMWKAEDGKIFATEAEAEKHEKDTEAIDYFEIICFRDMITCGEDVINFLISHRTKILEYYGIKE